MQLCYGKAHTDSQDLLPYIDAQQMFSLPSAKSREQTIRVAEAPRQRYLKNQSQRLNDR